MISATPKKYMLSVAPNGARKTQEDHPRLPITPAELAECAKAALAANANMIHMHVRDDAGGHSLDIARYEAATAAVRRAVGKELVVQITTEAVGIYAPEQQIALVRATRPEAVSVALREVLPDDGYLSDATMFFQWMHTQHVAAQYILYDVADVEKYAALRRTGAIPEGRHWVLFVLGRYSAGQVSSPSDLLPFLRAWEAADVAGAKPEWAMCAFGKQEADCAVAALALGGHARIGFENNMYLPSGELAPDNAALLRAVAAPAASLAYTAGTADELRRLLAV
jgi:uncharacterized protein (DUF849 family)